MDAALESRRSRVFERLFAVGPTRGDEVVRLQGGAFARDNRIVTEVIEWWNDTAPELLHLRERVHFSTPIQRDKYLADLRGGIRRREVPGTGNAVLPKLLQEAGKLDASRTDARARADSCRGRRVERVGIAGIHHGHR